MRRNRVASIVLEADLHDAGVVCAQVRLGNVVDAQARAVHDVGASHRVVVVHLEHQVGRIAAAAKWRAHVVRVDEAGGAHGPSGDHLATLAQTGWLVLRLARTCVSVEHEFNLA